MKPIQLAQDAPLLLPDARPGSASARIRSALRMQIVGMQRTPGEALAEKTLCEAFGVSRTPVREALLSLADENLVEIRPQIGTFVARISLQAVRDAMVIRRALERVSAREAALRATPRDVARLRAWLTEQARHTGRDGFFRFHVADEAMHQAIADISGHPNIWRVIRAEKAQVDRGRLLVLPQLRRRRLVVTQHRAIIEAIAAGDADRAETAMDAHLSEVLPSFTQIKRDYPDYFEDDDQPASGGDAEPATRAGRSSQAIRQNRFGGDYA